MFCIQLPVLKLSGLFKSMNYFARLFALFNINTIMKLKE